VWGAVAALLALLLQPGSAPAVQVDRYVALGDSYTAGVGIAPASTTGCLRSHRDYPHVVASRLARSRDVSLADVSCGAATTRNARHPQLTYSGVRTPPQLARVTRRADLVTVSLGVNDAGFASLITRCQAVAPLDPTGSPCRASFRTAEGDSLRRRMPRVGHRIEQVLAQVRRRAPNARVMLVGYPQPVPRTGTCPALPFAAGDYAYARRFFEEVGATMAATARRAGVTYVDVLAASAGHDVCAGDRAWVLGAIPSTRTAQWHPFASEQRAVAAMVVAALR
jgi:lysophospholipase L1-like esterase